MDLWLLLVPVIAVATMMQGSARRRIPTAKVSPEARQRLGAEGATWLDSTRSLRAELVSLEEEARTMLAQERALTGHRPFGREMDEVNFLQKIRHLRTLGTQWTEHGRAARASDAIIALGLEHPETDEFLLLPNAWRTDAEAEAMKDRSAEIEEVLLACGRLARYLSELDGALSAPAASVYR